MKMQWSVPGLVLVAIHPCAETVHVEPNPRTEWLKLGLTSTMRRLGSEKVQVELYVCSGIRWCDSLQTSFLFLHITRRRFWLFEPGAVLLPQLFILFLNYYEHLEGRLKMDGDDNFGGFGDHFAGIDGNGNPNNQYVAGGPYLYITVRCKLRYLAEGR